MLRKNGVMASLVIASATVATRPAQADLVINGWFNCSTDTFAASQNGWSDPMMSDNDMDVPMNAQCALIQAPLCHKHVCTSNKTIDLFVKRVLSTSSLPNAVPDVWFIQGGPGASSEGMESAMQDLIVARNGNVNVYTLDHRGTGRSHKFDCVAAQATTSGSPGGEKVTPQEFAACSVDVAHQYGDDLSAFSITSAASDIAMLLKELKSDVDSFVYGVSYGSAVVERLIHLNVTGIAGYILDGISTSSGAAPAERFEYFSTWDIDFGSIGDRFLELCTNDPFCGGKFGDKSPAQTLRDLYHRLDTSAEAAACTGIAEASKSPDGSTAGISTMVRKLLGTILVGTYRTTIPALIYRMDRCDEEDKQVLQFVFNATLQNAQMQRSFYQSSLLYQLITYSEMWEQPPPRQQVLQKRLTDQLITSGESADDLPYNCLFRMDQQSPSCQELQLDWKSLPKGIKPIAYPRDKYWNVSAKVPPTASVLLLNGKLDPQTNFRYAEYLYQAIDAKEDQKKLLLFEYLGHGTVFLRDDKTKLPCAMKILASYVEKGGDLSSISTECMNKQAPIKFELDSTESLVLGTNDAYDGSFLGIRTSRGRKKRQTTTKIFKVLFYIFVVLFAIGVVFVSILFCSVRKKRKQAEEEEEKEEEEVEEEGAKYTQVTDKA